MTCRHVVSAAIAPRTAAISVTGLLGGSDEPTTVPAAALAIPPGEWPDIAILKITEGAAESCVMTGRLRDPGWRLADDRLISGQGCLVGYQAQKFTAGFPAQGKGRRLSYASRVTWSSTGCPAVPWSACGPGLVVGILRITKGSGAALGGFSTMLADVLDQVPLLQPLVDRPPAAARQWDQDRGGDQPEGGLPRLEDRRPVEPDFGAATDRPHGRAGRRAAPPGPGTSACGTPGPATPAFACSGPRQTWVTACCGLSTAGLVVR